MVGKFLNVGIFELSSTGKTFKLTITVDGILRYFYVNKEKVMAVWAGERKQTTIYKVVERDK